MVAVAAPQESRTELQRLLPEASWEQADLTDPSQTAGLWARIDRLGDSVRWLVNVTGGYRGGHALDTSDDTYRFLVALNLDSCWWSCREGGRRIAEGGGGGIVNFSARPALQGGSGAAAYAVSKAGVLRLSQVLAEELAPRGVRVNAILPTLIDTAANRANRSEETMRKAVSPEAIASVVEWLCSDAASSLNGATLTV